MIVNSCTEIEELGSGRNRATIAVKPIAYQRSGAWHRITNTLGNSGDPNLTIGVNEYMDFRIRSRLSGNAPVYHIGRGNEQIRLTPLGTNNVDCVVSQNEITFPEAWNNADLKLIVGGHIIRKEIILRTGHPAAFEFRVDDHSGSGELIMLDPYLEKDGVIVPLTWITYQQGGKTIYRVELPAGDWASWVLDPQYVSQPDATNGIDNTIYDLNTGNRTENRGVNLQISVGENAAALNYYFRGLIKFNLQEIPYNAVIDSCVLSLYRYFDRSLNSRSMKVYRMIRSWLEGTGNGTATGDGSTWLTYNGSNNWGTMGASNVTSDYDSTAIGSVTLPAGSNSGASYATPTWDDITLTASKIQEWTSGLYTNNGMKLQNDTELDDLWGFYSSDFTTASLRPKLVIDYTTGVGRVSRVPYVAGGAGMIRAVVGG